MKSRTVENSEHIWMIGYKVGNLFNHVICTSEEALEIELYRLTQTYRHVEVTKWQKVDA